MHVTAILRLLSNLSVIEVEILKLKAQLIDGYDMLPGVVLKSACQESLREEEAYIIPNLPLIQKHFGVPLVIHSCRKFILALRSSVQLASGFIERKPFWSHILGTWLSKREFANSYSSSLMTI